MSNVTILTSINHGYFINSFTEKVCVCIKVVREMYTQKECTSLYSLKTHKAGCKVITLLLPPTTDNFHLHMLWFMYQLMIWKRANICIQSSPDQNCQIPHPGMMSQLARALHLLDCISYVIVQMTVMTLADASSMAKL